MSAQVQSLRSQLQEARDTAAAQQQDISTLKVKLECSAKDLAVSKSLFGETVQEQKQQEKSLQQVRAWGSCDVTYLIAMYDVILSTTVNVLCDVVYCMLYSFLYPPPLQSVFFWT